MRRVAFMAAFVVVASAGASGGAGALGVPAAQRISVTLGADCRDKKMVEAAGDSDCEVSVTVLPKSPTRTFTLQELSPGKGSRWTTLDKAKAVNGTATLDFTALIEEDGDSYYRDGSYRYRVTAPKTSKEKSFTSASLTIVFTPEDGTDDSANDQPAAAPVATTPKATPAAPTATQTPSAPAASTPAATAAPMPNMPNGGTPTNTTAPGGEDPNWFGGANPNDLGAFCMSGDPTMYVGSSICSGITGRKTVTQFKTLISPIPNAAPSYRRNGFCMQAFWVMGGLSLAQREAKCVEAGAGR